MVNNVVSIPCDEGIYAINLYSSYTSLVFFSPNKGAEGIKDYLSPGFVNRATVDYDGSNIVVTSKTGVNFVVLIKKIA